MATNLIPLVVLVGETGSGKSRLAIELAKKYSGEIIAADARTIYQGMDIGTAKSTVEERAEIAHHLIDIVQPHQKYTAADFQKESKLLIEDIHNRGKLPIMAGGTGLYVDSVLFNFTFLSKPDELMRKKLQQLQPDKLIELALARKIELRNDEIKNPRRVQRLIETDGEKASRSDLRDNSLVLGLKIDRKELRRNIEKRIDLMMKRGLKHEAKYLSDKYGWEAPGLNSIGYREWRTYFSGEISAQGVRSQILANSLNLAKRQRTWFKRNPNIQWIKNSTEAQELVNYFLKTQ